MNQPSPDAFFDAMDGVAYWTDVDGIIRGGGIHGWTTFAANNGAPGLQLGGLVGHNLFDLITGERVRQVYHRLAFKVLNDGEPHVHFSYRCDGPLIERQMRMTIGAVNEGGVPVGIFYHSQVMVERSRTRNDLLNTAANDLLPPAEAPHVTVCSFCHKVSWGGRWVRPRDYYEEGGVSDVHLDHDVCPSCEDNFNLL